MKNRDFAPELLRLALMLDVVILHSATGDAGVGVYSWLAKLMWPAVPCFVFISGYYGMKFNFGKIVSLYGIAVIYAFLNGCVMSHIEGRGLGIIFVHCMDCLKSYWFIHCYAFLMCCVPIINLALERGVKIKTLLPFFFLCFGWGFILTLPVIGKMFPNPYGLGPFSGLTFVGIYVFAMWVRRQKVVALPRIAFIMGIPSLYILVVLGFNDYNSPFVVLLAALLFLFAARLGKTRKCGRLLAFLAQSVFPIYLIHQTTAVKIFMRTLGININSWLESGLCTCVLVGVVTFVVCLLIDCIRRMPIFVTSVVVRKFSSSIDQ